MKPIQKAESNQKLNFPVLQILALKVYSFAFFYIPKIPLRFNRDYTSLIISRSPLQWFFITISMFHLLIHGLTTGLVALHVVIFRQSNHKLGWERLGMMTLFSFCFTGTFIFGISVLKIKDCIVSSFNELLKMKRALTLSGTIFKHLIRMIPMFPLNLHI